MAFFLLLSLAQPSFQVKGRRSALANPNYVVESLEILKPYVKTGTATVLEKTTITTLACVSCYFMSLKGARTYKVDKAG